MMECYRAHPGQVAMLLDMAAVFLYPTPMDFTFLKVTEFSVGVSPDLLYYFVCSSIMSQSHPPKINF